MEKNVQESRESPRPTQYMYVYSKSNNIENMINKWNTAKQKKYENENKT